MILVPVFAPGLYVVSVRPNMSMISGACEKSTEQIKSMWIQSWLETELDIENDVHWIWLSIVMMCM